MLEWCSRFCDVAVCHWSSLILVCDIRVCFLDRYSGKGPGSVPVAVDRGRGICSSLNSSGAVSDGAGAGERLFSLSVMPSKCDS